MNILNTENPDYLRTLTKENSTFDEWFAAICVDNYKTTNNPQWLNPETLGQPSWAKIPTIDSYRLHYEDGDDADTAILMMY